MPGSAFKVASSAAEVAAALHPSKSGKGPISPKRSRDDLVDENDPQSASEPARLRADLADAKRPRAY